MSGDIIGIATRFKLIRLPDMYSIIGMCHILNDGMKE